MISVVEVITALVLWMFLLPLFYGLGAWWANLIKVDHFILRGIINIAIGLGITGYAIIALGSMGKLKSDWTASLLMILFTFALPWLNEFWAWLKYFCSYLFKSPQSFACRMIQIIFFIAMGVSFICCFLPEIANDSLAYHLQVPKMFIQKASVLPLMYDEKSWRSLFLEELFVIPLFLKNVPAAILFHWVIGVLTAVAMMIWMEEEGIAKGIAWFLGVLFWLTPTLYNQIATSYTDAAVTFFALLSFYLFMIGIQRKRLPDFLISGILMGLSVSTKYLTLMMGAAMGVYLLYLLFFMPGSRGFIFRAGLLFSAGVLIASVYWFARNWVLTGDVLYPLVTQKFGTTGLYADQRFSQIGIPKTPLKFLMLPYYTAFFPNLFNRHHWIGPAYLFLLPFAFYAAYRIPKSRGPLGVALLTTLLWFLSAQDIRFLLPAFPLWIYTMGIGIQIIASQKKTQFKLAGQLAAFAALALYLALGFYHFRVPLLALSQNWGRETYLTRLERSYPISKWVNKNLPKRAKIFNANEVRAYYFEREMIDATMFWRLHREFRYLPPHELILFLKQKGITHILRSDAIVNISVQKKKPYHFDALDTALETDPAVKKMTENQSENIRELQYRYAVYEIV